MFNQEFLQAQEGTARFHHLLKNLQSIGFFPSLNIFLVGPSGNPTGVLIIIHSYF